MREPERRTRDGAVDPSTGRFIPRGTDEHADTDDVTDAVTERDDARRDAGASRPHEQKKLDEQKKRADGEDVEPPG